MDRREFVRRSIIVAIFGATGLTGVFALAQKTVLQTTTSQQMLQLPTINAQGGTNATSSVQSPNTGSTTTASSSVSNSSTTAQSTSNSQTSSSTNASSSVPAGYIFLAPLSALVGKTYAYFNHPNYGSSILINYNGTWKAFSALCTHAGCTVNFTSSELYCPCHSGYFSAVDGSVVSGPPPSALPEFGIQVVNNNLYVGSTRIN